MLLSRLGSLIALVSVAMAVSHPSRALAQASTPRDCQVTLASEGLFVPPSPTPLTLGENQFWFGEEGLWTPLPSDGIWHGLVPRKPGDFVYDNKSFWLRAYPGFSMRGESLTVVGNRVDGPAPSFTWSSSGSPSERDGDTAMIVGGMAVPVFGCWRITGRYADQELTFTVWVVSSPEQNLPSVEPITEKVKPPPRRIQRDAETQARSLVYSVAPELPDEARAANVTGTVVLHAIITTAGRASELRYLSGPRLLAQAAIDAVQWWRYEIATTKGNTFEALEVETTIQVVFPSVHN